MSRKKYLEKVVLGEDKGGLSWAIRAFAYPFSWVYRIGLALYLLLFRLGFRKRFKLPCTVISVGNITFGGTGKTPTVQTICHILRDRGLKVVILSRGHGGSATEATIVSDGENILTSSSESGDEPILHARHLTGVPVIIGKDRRASGRLAVERFSPDVIVLDDGLQYWQLHRDMDIIVMDAARPFGSGFVFPTGDLREPPAGGLARADAILINNANHIENYEFLELKSRISSKARNAFILKSSYKPIGFRNVSKDTWQDIDWIKDKRVVAFCGIAKPTSFLRSLEDLGAKVEKSFIYSDHHAHTSSDMDQITKESYRLGVDAIVTTEKDIARLTGSLDHLEKVFTLAIELDIEEASRFEQYLFKICPQDSEKKEPAKKSS